MSSNITRASDAHTKKAASKASKTLRNPRASKVAKSAAGFALSQRSQVDKGGVAYIVRDSSTEITLVTSSTAVRSVEKGAKKYSRVLARLANK
ncbi:MAG TPA: hypothetical protein ENI69_07375 [Rhodospirillales bacterium]|nr:hypothetical protein [Rhodospirillales bacterium]